MLFFAVLVLCDKLGGSWAPSISSVSCELVVCEKPPPLLNGLTEGDNYNYGDFVLYSCLPGFDMKVLLIIRKHSSYRNYLIQTEQNDNHKQNGLLHFK